MQRIAVIGSGPTALYTVARLVRDTPDAAIIVFESDPLAGTGMPFRVGDTDSALLANIASIEIPPVTQTYLDWLLARDPDDLRLFGVTPDDLSDRAFLPRVLLGWYLRDQWAQLLARIEGTGTTLKIYPETTVIDITHLAEGLRLTARHKGAPFEVECDDLVIATGHSWALHDEPDALRFASPWPSEKLFEVPAASTLIIGTSLSGLDAAVAIAGCHGRFVRDDAGRMRYDKGPDAEGLNLTLASRKGLLPEADFYCPLPYEPLEHCTEDRIQALIDGPAEGRIDAAFALMRAEIGAADPEYAAAIGLDDLSPRGFSEAYFAPRRNGDPFRHASDNLAEVEANVKARHTIAWRYAILRLHEALAPLVPHLSGEDRETFHACLKPVFVDSYAAVPPRSIERLLALHDAGCLDVMALGDDYAIEPGEPSGVTLVRNGERIAYQAYVDARGQRALGAADLPFPTLRRQLVQDDSDSKSPLELDHAFRPVRAGMPIDGIHCVALPFLLDRYPFVQGISAAHELGEAVGTAVLMRADRERTVYLS